VFCKRAWVRKNFFSKIIAERYLGGKEIIFLAYLRLTGRTKYLPASLGSKILKGRCNRNPSVTGGYRRSSLSRKDSVVGPGAKPVRAGSIGRDTPGQAEPSELPPNLSSSDLGHPLLTEWLHFLLFKT